MNTCLHCKSEFEPSKGHPHQKYCDKICKDRAAYARKISKKVVKTNFCLCCNKGFVPSKWSPFQKFCNEKCKRIFSNKKTSKKEIIKQCKHCNNDFISTSNNHKFCSDSCKEDHKSRSFKFIEKMNCKCCNVLFTPSKFHPNQMYCSSKCKLKRNPSKNELKDLKPCECCKKYFKPSNGQKYCSDKCKTKVNSIQRKLAKGQKCKVCDSNIPYGRVKRTCSEDCEAIWTELMFIKKKDQNKEYCRIHYTTRDPRLVTCELCESEFETTTNRKYCVECSPEAYRLSKAIYLKGWKARKALEKEELTDKSIVDEEYDDIIIPSQFLTRGNISDSSRVQNISSW